MVHVRLQLNYQRSDRYVYGRYTRYGTNDQIATVGTLGTYGTWSV